MPEKFVEFFDKVCQIDLSKKCLFWYETNLVQIKTNNKIKKLKMITYESEGERLADTTACAGIRADLKLCLLESDCCRTVSHFGFLFAVMHIIFNLLG